jgi:hypothetical protein
MPIQYSPFPEFQVPNLNLMGAYAQGEALKSQELAQAKTAQAMESAALKDVREEEKTRFDLASKKYDSLIDMAPRLNEKNYGAWYKQVTETFPLAAATLSPTYDPQTVSMLGLKGADLKPQVLQQHFGDTSRFVRVGATGGAEVVPGSEVTVPSYMEAGGEVYRKTPQGLVPAPIIQPSAEGIPSERLNMPAAKAAIANIESGGDYSALGPTTKSGDRAYGKYQVMGNNIPSWTKQALGKSLTPEQFLASPEAQEKVFEDQFARNTEKYGSAQDAASVWFSGKPLAKAGQRADVLGTTVPSYVNKFNAVYGRQAPVQNAMVAPITGAAPQMPVGPVAPPAGVLMPQQPSPVAPIPAPQPITVGTKTIVKGQTDVENTLGRMTTLYDKLDEMKEIPSEKRGPLENVGAYARGTTLGQEVEKARATPAQTKRNELKSLTRALLNDIKKSTGMSAQEINSNFELKNMLETLSDPTQSIESVRAILADLSSRYGSGKVAMPAESAAPAAAPSNRPPLSSFFKR